MSDPFLEDTEKILKDCAERTEKYRRELKEEFKMENYSKFIEDKLPDMPLEERKEWESMVFAADKMADKEVSLRWVATTLLGLG